MKKLLTALLLVSASLQADFAADKTLAEDVVFLGKVEVAMVKAALAISGETPTANPTVDLERHKLASNVIISRANLIGVFAFACVANGALTTSSTDADVEFTVNSVWNDVAGLSGLELGL